VISLPLIYPILDTSTLDARGCPVAEAAEALLEAGAGILQFRHKGPFTRSILASAERIGEMCRNAGALYVIDDRADVALLLNAGVHIGQDDLCPADARKVAGPDRIVGFSTHNREQIKAAAAEPVDYVAIGPIFPTGSKANPGPVLGIEELRHLRMLTARPLVAIGGITPESFESVWSAGADSIALIGALLPEPCTKNSIRARAELLLAAAKGVVS
jgi:thiamine-phosphate pyrophosphorylase